MPGHTYHEKIGDMVTSIIKNDDRTYCILSNDCSRKNREGGYHALPIFRIKGDGYGLKYARADLLIVHDGKITAQIEIEEQDRSPTKLFGKILVSAHCTFYQYKSGSDPREKGPIPFSDHFKFIQIVRFIETDSKQSGLPAKWKQVKMDIMEMLSKDFGHPRNLGERAIEYHLLYGSDEKIESELSTILQKQ